MKCFNCETKITVDDSLGAEVHTRRGKPVWKDVCQECYLDIVRDCKICGSDDVMPSNVSEFILVKNEFASTDYRPPGIYKVLRRPFMCIPMIGSGWLYGRDVLFVDRLPKPDASYDISGHICNECAKAYRKIARTAYGRKNMQRRQNWTIEREHTRNVILQNPDMLRDLECDKADHSDWADLKELYCLPDSLPTYHEWIFLKYKGVTVYKAHQSEDVPSSWCLLRPEPKYRRYVFSGRHREHGVIFAASGLPTFPRFDYDDPKNKDNYHSPDSYAREHSLKAIRLAIAKGFITQKGTFDANGKPAFYG